MRKLRRILSLALALVMCVGLMPTARAAAPEAGIRDIQTHYWVDVPEMTIDSVESFNEFRNAVSQKQAVHFMLYDNGDLYLSTKEVPDEKSFSLVAENVKEITSVKDIPLLCGAYYDGLHQGPGMTGVQCYLHNFYLTTNLTMVLTEDNELYMLGCPPEFQLAEEYFERNGGAGAQDWYRLCVQKNYPLSSYASEPTELIKLTESIAHVVPSYQFQVTFYGNVGGYVNGSFITKDIISATRRRETIGSKGFYIDTLGNSYFGFPGLDENSELADSNIINYLPFQKTRFLEDGTLVNSSETIAQNVRDFCTRYYLTDSGELYDYNGEKIDTEVTMISEEYYIREDGALWSPKGKIMEDVAAVFGAFAVRENGEVYLIETDSKNQLIPRKILSGNGYAPSPAPVIHTGKIFKDASSWALVDLRTARDSGLTVPADGLSYDQPITREKFAEVSVKLYEALTGKPAPAATKNPFTDTKNPEVLKAHALGIVNGTSATTFSPDTQISRESIAAMLMRTVNAAGAKLPTGTPVTFADDGKISGWAKDAVTAMANANIVRGVGGNRFDPQGTATVEQSIIMANRILR